MTHNNDNDNKIKNNIKLCQLYDQLGQSFRLGDLVRAVVMEFSVASHFVKAPPGIPANDVSTASLVLRGSLLA